MAHPAASTLIPTPAAAVTPPHVSGTARAKLRHNGFVALAGLWDPATTAALAQEAHDLWTSARPPTTGPTRRVAPSRPGVRPTMLSTGPVLEALHHELAGLTRTLTAQLLVPSFAAYYFYEHNDEVRLHLDTEQCDLTMITEVLGDLGPLRMHPELAGMSIDELFELEEDARWDRESGVAIQHPRSGVTAFRGRRLAHHRPGRDFEGIGAVAALHYQLRYGA